MATAPAENSTPVMVIYTGQGDQALDRVAARLVKDCDGSPAGIANVLERLLTADIAELADALSQSGTRPPPAQHPDENPEHENRENRDGHEIRVTGPQPESPEQATPQRLTQGEHPVGDSMSASDRRLVRR